MLPSDPRALRLAEISLLAMANSVLLVKQCRNAGASVRTMERIFQRELGMSFEEWRRQARIVRAVELLVEGYPVKEVAAYVGYRHPSAFIELFRRTLGTTPKSWASAALLREQ
jgi:AraC-like DNA-binding protein